MIKRLPTSVIITSPRGMNVTAHSPPERGVSALGTVRDGKLSRREFHPTAWGRSAPFLVVEK